MKKLLFLITCLFVINVLSAQGIDQYGKIVTNATLNSLSVGTVTYPAAASVNGALQILTAVTNNGTTTANWSDSAPIDGNSRTLTASDSGKIIYLNGNAILFSDSLLPDGFTAVIINTGNDNTVTSPLSIFYSRGINGGSFFQIPSQGVMRLYVISVSGSKRYYLSGDIVVLN